MFVSGFILLAAAILAVEAVRIFRDPKFVLSDFEGDLPPQSAINFRALAAGAPLSSALFLGGGVYFGIDPAILLIYLALVLGVVAIVRLLSALGKPNNAKQYQAVVVEFIAAFVAIYLTAR